MFACNLCNLNVGTESVNVKYFWDFDGSAKLLLYRVKVERKSKAMFEHFLKHIFFQ